MHFNPNAACSRDAIFLIVSSLIAAAAKPAAVDGEVHVNGAKRASAEADKLFQDRRIVRVFKDNMSGELNRQRRT
jgi:hypothetical protein